MTPIYDRSYAQGEFELHGESWLQQKLAGKLNTILDVGSNIGEWTYMARQYNPTADVHTFEVVPETYRKLLTNIDIDSHIIPNGFGLSNYSGILRMKYRPDYAAVSTHLANLRVDNFEWRDGLVMTGDQYVASRQLGYVDFLKIDTEGAEQMVLEGFAETLKQNKIGVIQFEYGYAAILSKWLLVDAYEMLTPHGFNLGRLTKDGIQFHEYALYHETFNGPDYVAVHHTKMNLFM
jgi:FkbM family methyltransferase